MAQARLVAAVSLVAVAALWWWASPRVIVLGQHMPLGFESGAQAVALPAFGERGAYVLDYRDGAYVDVVIPVRNDGRLAIELEDLRLTDQVLPLTVQVAARGRNGALPLTLAPGDEVDVILTVRFDHCDYYHERELALIPGAVARVRSLGRSSDQAVAFAHDLIVRSPMIVGCPDRLIDRQARNRSDVAP